jgi:uncharacterized protein (PEP-CTERM system associated)
MRKWSAFSYPVIMAFIAAPAGAAQWTNSASVTPGLTYTDNVCLSKDNEQDEWIGTFTPEGSINADGNRANLNVTGSVEFNTLTDDDLEDKGCTGGGFGDREQFAPRLSGSADAILVENWFFIDSTARISQNDVTPFASGGSDSFNRTGNTNTTYSYTVSPYLARRFKDTAELNLRYTWDEQFNSADSVEDSTRESVQGLLSSVPGVSRYGWGLQGDYSKVSYDDSFVGDENFQQENIEDSELSSARVIQSLQLDRSLQANGFFGQEWNDFVSSRDDIDGTFWDAGLRWTPNVRTTVDAGYGDRFFGSSPRFAATYRHKRSAFRASYAETVTFNRDIRTLEDSPPLNPDFPPPPGVEPGVTTLSESPILDKRYTLGYSWRGQRTGFGASAFQSEQTELGSSTSTFTQSDFRGVSLSADRSLSQQTTLNAGLNWSEDEPEDSQSIVDNRFLQSSEQWRGSLGVSRQLGTHTNLGLNYLYTDRQSDNDFDSYTENRVTLDLRIDL